MRISKENAKYTIYWYEDTKTIVVYDPMKIKDFLGLKKYLNLKRHRYPYQNLIIKSGGGRLWV